MCLAWPRQRNGSLMGRCQRGVYFGAVSLKRDEESSKFPIAKFLLHFFSYTFSFVLFDHLFSVTIELQCILKLGFKTNPTES